LLTFIQGNNIPKVKTNPKYPTGLFSIITIYEQFSLYLRFWFIFFSVPYLLMCFQFKSRNTHRETQIFSLKFRAHANKNEMCGYTNRIIGILTQEGDKKNYSFIFRMLFQLLGNS